MKGLFLSVPSISVSTALIPVVNEMARSGFKIIYYNAKEFAPDDNVMEFRPYSPGFNGYYSNRIDTSTSYFDFGEILVDAATSTVDFIVAEVEREKPDFIMHSHLALWGRLIASKFGLPSVALFSVSILDERIMLPHFRNQSEGGKFGFATAHGAVNFYRKSQALFDHLQIKGKPMLWDAYVNKGDLNVCLILKSLQSRSDLFDAKTRFVGFPMAPVSATAEREFVYVSMGTILKQDLSFFKLCIDVLKQIPYKCVITGADTTSLGPMPPNVELVGYTDQRSVLKQAKLFITHGGMSSIQEAIYTQTPMIALPVIAEQELNAIKIAELGVGRHIGFRSVNGDNLLEAINGVLLNYNKYVNSLKALANEIPALSPGKSASSLVKELLAGNMIRRLNGGPETTVIEMFERQAEINPEASAVFFGPSAMSYHTLDRRSTGIALYLNRNGIGRGDLVPIILETGADLVAAILGVLKAGAGFVPIDHEYPKGRIDYILKDTAARVTITSDTIQLLENVFGNEEPLGILPRPAPSDIAYVIYTSGSTGRPKGVVIEHRQILLYTLDITKRFGLEECNSYAILGTLAADAGYTAFFAALCYGMRLVLIDIKSISGPVNLAEAFNRIPIDCYKTTPSMMQFLLQNSEGQELLPAKRMILGGEACPLSLARDVQVRLPKGCRMFNHYGPTETTIGVITYEFPADPDLFPESISLGKPLRSVNAWILDDNNNEVPDETTAELCIEGGLVGRGYLNNPEATAQKFVAFHFDYEIRRLYRTGDIAWRGKEGDITCLGRNDDQVKINGNRIALGEIEEVILRSGMAEQCAVVAREDKIGAKFLAGYVVPSKTFDKGELTSLLQAVLPHYMIPARWMTLNKMPLTFNNKVDRRALPEVGGGSRSQTEAAPGDLLVTIIGRLWGELLGIDNPGLDDDFFELGGDSMQLIRLSFEIKKVLDTDISSRDLFRYSTIRTLTGYLAIKKGRAKDKQDLEGFDASKASLAQRDLYLQNKLYPTVGFPNSALSFQVIGSIDLDRLERAMNDTILSHESLRMSFITAKGSVEKKVLDTGRIELAHVKAKSTDVDGEIMALTLPFDFNNAPLIRAFIIDTPDGRRYLHIDMPHINSDGESLKIIVRELGERYGNSTLLQNKLQFTDFQKYVYGYTQSQCFITDRDFWESRFEPDITRYVFKSKSIKGNSRFEGSYFVASIPNELAERIGDFARQQKITRFQFLLISYLLVVHKLTLSPEVVVMLPVQNRDESHIDEVVGLLVNVVLLRSHLPEGMSKTAFVLSSKEMIVDALDHHRFPLEQVLKSWTSKGRDAKRLLNCFFGYHDHRESYKLGEADLRLYVPLKDKENLPLSAAVFDTGSDLCLRVSSAAAYFDKDELQSVTALYLDMISGLLATNDDEQSVFVVDGRLN